MTYFCLQSGSGGLNVSNGGNSSAKTVRHYMNTCILGIDCLCIVFGPSWEFSTSDFHRRDCKFWHILGNYGHLAMRVLWLVSPYCDTGLWFLRSSWSIYTCCQALGSGTVMTCFNELVTYICCNWCSNPDHLIVWWTLYQLNHSGTVKATVFHRLYTWTTEKIFVPINFQFVLWNSLVLLIHEFTSSMK